MDADAIVEKLVQDSIQRVSEAERLQRETTVAWASGFEAMQKLWMSRFQEAEKRLEQEYDDLFSDTDGGSSGESGGSEPDDGTSTDDGDSAQPPSA